MRSQRFRHNLVTKQQQQHWFPMAAVPNYHKLGGLKQHDLLFYCSGGQKPHRSFRRLKSRCWKLQRESVFLPTSGGYLHSSAHGSTPQSASLQSLLTSSHLFFSDLDPLDSLFTFIVVKYKIYVP